MTCQRLTEKDLEGSGHTLLQILYQHLPGAVVGHQRNPIKYRWCPGQDSIQAPPEYKSTA